MHNEFPYPCVQSHGEQSIENGWTCYGNIHVHRRDDTPQAIHTYTVCPHLEYGNVVWCPRFQLDKLEVEKMQMRARKLISNWRILPYKDRLEAPRLPSLCYPRR